MSLSLSLCSTKAAVDLAIRNNLDCVVVLRFGQAEETTCLQLDEIDCFYVSSTRPRQNLSDTFVTKCCSDCGGDDFFPSYTTFLGSCLKLAKSARDVSKFAVVFLVDAGAPSLQTYLNYFDVTLLPATLFFFNAQHMKMDCGTADHTKWIGTFQTKQDFIDVVEVVYRGAMHGKLIVTCPLPPERIPRYQLLYKDF